MINKTKLQAQIEARNAVNAECNRLKPILASSFAPLVGQKVLKADGSLLEKFANLEPQRNAGFIVYRLSSKYSLAFMVRVCVGCEKHGCVYDERAVYVGELDGQNLRCLINTQLARTDFSEREISDARASVQKAKDALSTAQNALCQFGEY